MSTQKKSGEMMSLVFCDVFLMENTKIKKLLSYLMEVKAENKIQFVIDRLLRSLLKTNHIMHNLILGFVFVWLMNFGTANAADHTNDIPALLNLEADVQQALIVHPDQQTSYQATITAWTKKSAGWIQIFDAMPAVIGRNGMAPLNEKREGDGRTPSGIYQLGTAFGYENHIDTILSYRQVTEKDHWVDDPESKQYNQWITGPPEAKSFENLKREDDLYKYAVVIEYNTSPVKPNEGSAIFLHIWRAPDKPTAGCVATDETNIKQFLSWLDESKKPMILLNISEGHK